MPKKFDVVKAMGTYTDAQGQEKTRWLKCGLIIENPQSGKWSLKMDAIPYGLPDDEGWFALMTPQPRQPQAQAPSFAPQVPMPNAAVPQAPPVPQAPVPQAPMPAASPQIPGQGYVDAPEDDIPF